MSAPTGEFRTAAITLSEPADRVIAGSIVNETNPLDFGAANNTDGTVRMGPKVFWWRCTDLAGFSLITNMKFWLSSNSGLNGANEYYCDITSIWTQNKTVTQVAAGTPGQLPQSLPSANLKSITGGDITSSGHLDTSQYIYLALALGQNETVGIKGGSAGGFQVSLKFDYY